MTSKKIPRRNRGRSRSVGEASETQGSGDDDLDALLKQASASEGSDVKVQRANKLAQEGDFTGAWISGRS